MVKKKVTLTVELIAPHFEFREFKDKENTRIVLLAKEVLNEGFFKLFGSGAGVEKIEVVSSELLDN